MNKNTVRARLKSWACRAALAAAAVLGLLLLSPMAVLALEIRGGASTSVGRGQTLNEDLFAWGGAVNVDGTVNGDVFAAGGSVGINGTVNGSVTAAGGTINISGRVTHSLRMASGILGIDGIVDGDATLLGRSLVIGPRGRVGGHLQMVMKDVQIKGTVEGDLSGSTTYLAISGLVLGNLDISAETLIIEATAEVRGDIYYVSPSEIQIAPGAKITGTVTQRFPEPISELARPPSLLTILRDRAVTYLMALLIGVVLLFVLPRRMNGASQALQSRPWASLGWGALIFVAVPAAASVIALTVIGIPLALIVMALYGITLYLTQLPISLTMGRLILEHFRRVEGRWLQVVALALGLAILELVRAIPIPYWAWLIFFLVFVFGLGAILVSERRFVNHGR